MKLKGSIVLEASFVFPIVLVSVFIILLLAYYKHDGIVLKSGMKRQLIRTLEEEKTYDFNEEAPLLYYMVYEDFKLEQKNGEGRVSARLGFPLFPRFLKSYGSKEEKRSTESYQAYRPQAYVRKLSILIE